ncbi:Asp-tRNA(Asn)/Glu-tRNA(Gln) amidotransferase subunit GatC [Allorhodopirellula heiligendammensis]|uniref:Aspartyl/glutamyl-tRNA(Asn/Gln) amidotransferase subunit C n=1 Tax=Allorhodopirellula heiligendammensis TaxID=2714739 RepID=A0A5C6C1N8_9BACT|nr:Asp-tRNA(Asn)/Glu-tRNA(Gln) amidotransferase subunit GatC [Allorhodopirellula heiligendammensis]TWU18035.1 Glutamyl-tRNA(Gln) amidotransferase subunit C [Allorhodopirellula heiligendammensis]
MSQSVDIEKLAHLAKLDLTDAERESFGPQIGEILAFVEQLNQLDTEGVEPMTSALDVQNRFRDDVAGASLSAETATRSAPAAQDGFFLVPPVLGTAATGKSS